MFKKLMVMVVAGIMFCMPMVVNASNDVQADFVYIKEYIDRAEERPNFDDLSLGNYSIANQDEYSNALFDEEFRYNGVMYRVDEIVANPYEYGVWTEADIEFAKSLLVSDIYEDFYVYQYDASGNITADASQAVYTKVKHCVVGKNGNGDLIRFNFYKSQDAIKGENIWYTVSKPIRWFDMNYKEVPRPY